MSKSLKKLGQGIPKRHTYRIYNGKGHRACRKKSMLFTMARVFPMKGHFLEDLTVNQSSVYKRGPLLPASSSSIAT